MRMECGTRAGTKRATALDVLPSCTKAPDHLPSSEHSTDRIMSFFLLLQPDTMFGNANLRPGFEPRVKS